MKKIIIFIAIIISLSLVTAQILPNLPNKIIKSKQTIKEKLDKILHKDTKIIKTEKAKDINELCLIDIKNKNKKCKKKNINRDLIKRVIYNNGKNKEIYLISLN